MGRTKARSKKSMDDDATSNLGMDNRAAGAPKKRGRPKKVIQHHESEDQEEKQEEEEEMKHEVHSIRKGVLAYQGDDHHARFDPKPFFDDSFPDSGSSKDALNAHTKEEEKEEAPERFLPKKRGRPPKAKGIAAPEQQQGRAKRGFSRRKSEPHRAAGFAAK